MKWLAVFLLVGAVLIFNYWSSSRSDFGYMHCLGYLVDVGREIESRKALPPKLSDLLAEPDDCDYVYEVVGERFTVSCSRGHQRVGVAPGSPRFGSGVGLEK